MCNKVVCCPLCYLHCTWIEIYEEKEKAITLACADNKAIMADTQEDFQAVME